MSLFHANRPLVTLVLPVYNAETFIERTLRDVHAWLARRPEDWELLIVDDASTDRTPALVERFLAAHPDESIVHVRFTGNRGKGFATRAGLGLAHGEYAIFTDCDLAYPIENAGRILARLQSGIDTAIACRVLPESTYLISPSFFSYLYTRHLMGRFFNLLCRAIAVPRLLDTQAGLKGFRSAVVRPLLGRLVMDGFSFDVELLRGLIDRKAAIVEVPVSFRYDSEPSTVRFILDSALMIRDLIWIRFNSLRGRYGAAAAVGDPPRLAVHADDFGLSPGVNAAIEHGLVSGVLSGASILVGSPHAGVALRWAAEHPWFDFGVHLNLTQGAPVLPPAQVPSLVDRSGRFLPLSRLVTRLLTRRLRKDEVLAEWRAQIELARAAGVPLTHLDSHRHIHLLPGLFGPATLPLAKEAGVPIRAMDGPVRGRWRGPDLKGLGLSVASRVAFRGSRRRSHGPCGSGTALMKRPTLSVIRSLLSRMKPGRSYELVVHPGVVDAALRSSGDRYVEGREREQELLLSQEYRAVLRHAGIELRAASPGPHADVARRDGQDVMAVSAGAATPD